MKRLGGLVVVALLVGLFSVPVTPVAACSGWGILLLSSFLEYSSVVAKVRVLDFDEVGLTGVVEVIHYLKGSGINNRLLVTQEDPMRVAGRMRSEINTCGSNTSPFTANEEMYLLLNRNVEGIYTAVWWYRFPAPDYVAEVGADEIINPHEYRYDEMTETEFEALVLENEGTALSFPTITNEYPLPAPILITMVTGNTYLLPVDHAPPVLLSDDAARTIRRRPSLGDQGDRLGISGCNIMGCTAYSNSGVYQLTLTEEGISFSRNYILTQGHGFLFSSDKAFAIWTDTTIDIYKFNVATNISLVAQHPINQGHSWIAQAAWSPNDSFLAYSDANGLWLYDVYWRTPRLLVPAHDNASVATARYFSPNERFLAITHEGINSTINLVTGQVLPDGVFSPSEEFWVTFEPLIGAPDPEIENRESVLSLCSIQLHIYGRM